MSLHELHPEELIDRAEQGELDASEQAKLDRHLAACAVCRFELKARDDFRLRDRDGDRYGDDAFSDDAIDMIVGASLRGADAHKAQIHEQAHDDSREELRVESNRPRALAAGRRWGVLLAVAVLLVSAQATARWLGIRAPSWLAPQATTTVNTTSDNNDDSMKAAPSKMKPAAAISIPDQPAPPRDLTVSNVVAPSKSTSVTPVRSNSGSSAIPDPTASALFTKANADRVQGRHIVATREYRELLENYPNAPEADLSRATLGRLLLDDGDTTAALTLFDAYLKADGPLREETMVNRATALERLHRTSEEADAWQTLLDSYPQSMHAERARDRLKELGTH